MSATRRGAKGPIEKGFAVGAMFLFMDALVPLLGSGGDLTNVDLQEGDRSFQALAALVYLTTLILVLPRAKQLIGVFARDPLLYLLVAISLVSITWSANPGLTLRRGVALVGTTLFGTYLVMRYRPGEFLRLLAWALGLAALLSLLFALALPGYGVHMGGVRTRIDGVHDGYWRGVFQHKNVLGRVMTLGVAVFLLLATRRSRCGWVGWAGVGLSLGLVLLSGSRTAWAASFLILLLFPALRVRWWHYPLALPFVLLAALLAGVAALWLRENSGAVLEGMGRDATLTGRTDLWEAAVESGLRRPWLGHGYRAFWTGAEGSSAEVWHAVGWDPPHGHNSFVDLWLELGSLGVMLYGLCLLTCLGRLFKVRNIDDYRWFLTGILYVLIISISDVVILSQNNVTWVIFVTTSSYLATDPESGP